MPLGRRFPLYARPAPAAASLVALILGVVYGLSWTWDWALQTGNIFIVISIPTALISFDGLKPLFLAVLLVGLVGFLAFGRVPQETAAVAAGLDQRGIWAPRMRFYPMLLLFGLFLAYFGTVFLFKASISGAEGGVGWSAFIYLNYDGILNRAAISIFGATILAVGLYVTLFLTWKWGLGFEEECSSPFALVTRASDEEMPRRRVVAARPTPAPTPRRRRAPPLPRATARTIKTAPGTPRQAPSIGRPSSTSRPVHSLASRAPLARTATTSKRPSKALSREAAGMARP